MKTINLENLTDAELSEICIHATARSSLYPDAMGKRDGIAKEGLVATRGDWEVPKDDKENPRIFFCQGIDGMLMRFAFTNKQTKLKTLRHQGKLPYGADIGDEHLEMSAEEKKKNYERYYQAAKGSVLLHLDIPDTIAQNLDDEVKKALGDNYDWEIQEKVYGDVASIDRKSMKQNKWDMSTRVGENIPPEKISLTAVNGSTCGLDIVKFICEKVKTTKPKLWAKLDDAQGLMAYIETREAQNSQIGDSQARCSS